MNDQHNMSFMMLAMMAMCAVPLLLIAIIPAIGLWPGLAVGILAAAVMALVHFKFMRGGH